jgi:hypothetical protein
LPFNLCSSLSKAREAREARGKGRQAWFLGSGFQLANAKVKIITQGAVRVIILILIKNQNKRQKLNSNAKVVLILIFT